MKAHISFTVITIFPDMVYQTLSYGVIGKAIEAGLISVQTVNPRDFSQDKHQRVDDRPFGGGAGMVMMYDPLARAMKAIKKEYNDCVLTFLSPQGKTLDQTLVNSLAQRQHITLLCGRYEGIDQRFLDEYIDEEVSLGDFVISGGELAAATVIDAVARQTPGVLGDQESAKSDSFMNNAEQQVLLGPPQYTRSEQLKQQGVPPVLLSGDHAKIAQWRAKQALDITRQKRPDLLNDK